MTKNEHDRKNLKKYRHKTIKITDFLQLHSLFITEKGKDYVQKVTGLEFVICFRDKYFPVVKMEKTLQEQDFFRVSQILSLDLPRFDVDLPRFDVDFSKVFKLLSSAKCPRQEILEETIKILLNEEMAMHFYEIKEDIHEECKNNINLARYRYLKLLFYEMWFLELWSTKIWLPYLSKIWHLIKKFYYLISCWF